jgi:glutaredoxin
MKPIVGLALLLSISSITSASAQVYKWTDSKGVVHYSDTPVSSQSAVIGAGPAAPPSLALPYELAEAARKFPVTLYSASTCAACDQGRSLLKGRGVPFVEKTVASDADAAKLKEAGSNGQLPLLVVGRGKLVGFQAEDWHAALTAAAYPRRSMLPKNYRYQTTSAADPMVVPATPAAVAADARPRIKDRPKQQERSDLPPGFQF